MLCSGLFACCLLGKAICHSTDVMHVSLPPDAAALAPVVPDIGIAQLRRFSHDMTLLGAAKAEDLCAHMQGFETDTGENPIKLLNQALGETMCPKT